MSNLYLHGGTIVLPDRLVTDGAVACVDGLITGIYSHDEFNTNSPARTNLSHSPVANSAQVTIDLTDRYLCPGFVDLHVHGGAGADFMDGTVDATRIACAAHALHGTTTLYPTTSTGSPAQIHRMLASCKSVMSETGPPGHAKIGGVHLYGPYFAKEKSGCHLQSECRDPHNSEYESYFETDIIRIATCAAELEGAAHFYQCANQRGCLITCGHSNASWTEMQAAFDLGMRHVDHFWCAMSNVSSVRKQHGFPMQGSMLEFVLGQPEMSTEVIADGQHLSPELLRFAWQIKSSQRLCLVTDCNRALDMPPGRYRFGAIEDGAWFESNGEVGLASPDALASSIRGMDFMVQTMLTQTDIPLVDVIRMASLTPAQRVKADDQIGSIEIGKLADFVILNQKFQIEKVFISGQELTAPLP